MRLDRSDLTPVLTILLAGGFAFIATGSMTLRVTDRDVLVEERVPATPVTARTGVVEPQRVEAMEALGARIERAVRPAIYVDGVLVEPGAMVRDLDPTEIRSVTVLRGSNEIRIESEAR